MSAEFKAEFEALGSVYGEDHVSYNETLRRLVIQLPNGQDSTVSIKVDIPEDYPAMSAPRAVDSETASKIISSIFHPGQEVLLQFVEAIRESLPTQPEVKPAAQGRTLAVTLKRSEIAVAEIQEKDLHPSIFVRGEQLTVSKSRFVGHAAKCASAEEARDLLQQIRSSKYSRATHNMWAYRLRDGRADNEDDGEAAAGSRLAELLHVLDAKDVFVVVTRYYGGIQLGPQRFKIIAQAGRSAFDAYNERLNTK